MLEKLKAAAFVYVIRHLLRPGGEIRDCPVCGCLIQWYSDYGWLHLADGDADCYGALNYGKGKPRA